MRSRLTTIGILILVMAVILLGLTGCERKAESREPETAEPEAGSPSGVTPDSGQQAPAPGETIVSAVSPAAPQPGTGTAVVSAPEGGTAVTSQPEGSTDQPTAVPPTAEPPAAQPETPDEPADGYIWYTVQRGDTVYSIATRYGTTVNAISAANGLTNPSQIYAGQKLKIPTSGSTETVPPAGSTGGCRIRHTVQPGEWVYQIARNYGVSAESIVTASGLTNPSLITPGTVLCIP